MPAARATASIETAWKPSRSTIALVASRSCSRRCSPVMRMRSGYISVAYGNVTCMDVAIAIVGSGFSGLGLALRLRREGFDDFAVLERGEGVGGTWHFNTYPGCACDVPSHLYSFSFAPNPDWTRTYSKQPEIRAYLERVAAPVMSHVRLDCEVQGARWDGS